jgi:hypothetical protein
MKDADTVLGFGRHTADWFESAPAPEAVMSLFSRLMFRKKPSIKVVFVKSLRNSTDV